MGIFSTARNLVRAAIGLARALSFALVLCSPVAYADGPCIEAGAFKKLEPIDCSGKPESCKQCNKVINEQKKKSPKFDEAVHKCTAGAGSCAMMETSADPRYRAPSWVDWLTQLSCPSAYASGGGTQRGSSVNGNKTSAAAATCERNAAAKTREAGQLADACASAIKDACSDFEEAKKSEDACREAGDKARQTAAADEAKAAEADKNAEKNADNAKKEGGMPQMPQIPQMPQTPQSQSSDTSAATATDPSVSSATATQVETTRLDMPGNSGSSTGFGGGAATQTSTTTSPGYPGASAGGNVQPSERANETGFGTNATPTNGFGGMMSSGGGSGGGGSSSGTGASSPLPPSAPASAADANAYDVSGGGGGKLGAPKGFKSGGEPDSAIAESVKDVFKADIGAADAGRNPASEGQSAPEDDTGFTVFKMVKSRYLELKRRGSI